MAGYVRSIARIYINNVADQILALRVQAGDFGELVYAGMDWVDPGLAKRSMELKATELMPRVNKAIAAAQHTAPMAART